MAVGEDQVWIRVFRRCRVTIPKQLRSELGIKAGMKATVANTPKGVIITPIRNAKSRG